MSSYSDQRRSSFVAQVSKIAELFDGSHAEGFAEVDRIVAEGFAENFYNAIGPDGEFWQPRKDNLPHPLLMKTLAMFNAATQPTNPGHFFEVQGDLAEFGVKDEAIPYAKYHDRGTYKMPPRPFAYASLQVEQRAFDAFVEVLDRQIENL